MAASTFKSKCAVVSSTANSDISIKTFEIGAPPVDSIHVKVELAGICGTDPHLWKGDMPLPADILLGHEGVGEVVELHSSITTDHVGQTLSKGDRVYWTAIRPCNKCYSCVISDDECGCTSNGFMHPFDDVVASGQGTWATYTQYATLGPRNAFFRISPDVPLDAYIALGCALPTVVQAVRNMKHGGIQPGSTVVVQGCGAVGLAAIMMAKIADADKVVAMDFNPARLAKAAQFGAQCIDMNNVNSLEGRAATILNATGNRGVDLVIECSGHPSAVEEGLTLVGRKGTYLMIGTWAGKGNVPMDPFVVVNKAITIQGSTYCAPADYYLATKIVERNWKRFPLASCVTHRFSLDETQAGLETVLAGKAVKAVIQPHDM
ncbi:5-exo-hydroxycamphor dehydrogenase [Fusarium sp. NRRL 52700]|nr:5-exo-hydroxycamphor dehydrogenase [Fusarium sp. NRRL 52700]